MDTTIIYYTDGSVSDVIGDLVRKYISKAKQPIISVSQQPLDFGTNICVGKIGRSWKSIQSQIMVGLLSAKTKYIALAEHDMLYPEGYFDWIPPRDDTFYYNKNRVFAVAKKGSQYGMYIPHVEAHPNSSQLICNRKLFIGATIRRIYMLDSGVKKREGWCEPGFNWKGEKYDWWYNDKPTVDILHNDNFTVRYGTYKEEPVWEVDGWGRFEDIK